MNRLTPFALAAVVTAAAAFATVRAEDKDSKPAVGKPAPAIDLPATSIDKVLKKKDAKTLSLKDLEGKNVVLFFYPKALTPGCTTESCGFRDKAEDFAKANTVLLGISNDTVEKQQQFTDKHKLPYPLFADVDKKVTKAYGAFNEQRGLPFRYTYVIDKKGVLRKIYTDVKPASHPAEVLKYVQDELK